MTNTRTLNAAVEAAIRVMNADPTEANKAAYRAAWAARTAARPQPKAPRDYSAAARSGRRQHAEMRAKGGR